MLRTEPKMARPVKLIPLPMRQNALIETLLPQLAKLNVERAPPMLVNVLIDTDEPRVTKFIDETEPPILANVLIDTELASDAKPTTLIELPKRAKLRTDRDDPTVA
jgi:hypothetical protein